MEDKRLKVNIAQINPAGSNASDELREVREGLYHAFSLMDFLTSQSENDFITDGLNLVLGAHLLDEDDFQFVPDGCILYNVSTVDSSDHWNRPELIQFFSQFEIWDSHESNIRELEDRGVTSLLQHVPIGYVPELTRIPESAEQDIDVLFYGSPSPRRQSALDDLGARGLKVQVLTETFGDQRDEYIARSKVILNIHSQHCMQPEIVRLSYLLANAKAIVTEQCEASSYDTILGQGMRVAPYEGLVDACVELVQHTEERNSLGLRGLNNFQSQLQAAYVQQSLQAIGGQSNTASSESSKTQVTSALHHCSEANFNPDFINFSSTPECNPDVLADLSDPGLLNKTVHCDRLGEVTFLQNQFDEIVVNDSLASTSDLTSAMTNCLQLLKDGGRLRIDVPYDLSYNAWAKPTYKRAFNERSWAVYTDHYASLGWTDACFDATELDVTFSPMGEQLIQQQHPVDAVLTQPRAVESLQVVLTKRLIEQPSVAVDNAA